eukprot:3359571-Prymnesium_polylepis.2
MRRARSVDVAVEACSVIRVRVPTMWRPRLCGRAARRCAGTTEVRLYTHYRVLMKHEWNPADPRRS